MGYYLQETRSFSSNQHGFLPLLEKRVTRLMDEGPTVNLFYLDFAKAFDSVNHRLLLAKLTSSGIDGLVFNWIESCLSGRPYKVQFDDILSEEAPCLNGAPKV